VRYPFGGMSVARVGLEPDLSRWLDTPNLTFKRYWPAVMRATIEGGGHARMGYDWQVSSPREPPRPLGQHASSMPPSPPMQSPLPIWSPSSYLSATRCSAVCAVANPRSARGVCSVRGMCISPPSFLPPHASLSRSLPLLPPRARTPYLPYISLTSLRPSLLLLTQGFGSRVPAEPLHVSPL